MPVRTNVSVQILAFHRLKVPTTQTHSGDGSEPVISLLFVLYNNSWLAISHPKYIFPPTYIVNFSLQASYKYVFS